MNEDWVKIMDSSEGLAINLASAKLDDEGVQNVILDKKDSAYVVIGRAELYVLKTDEEKARKIIQESS